jgi:hypothetical protein
VPRFVLLEHDHPHRHWDFLLEAGPALHTWRLAAPPQAGEAIVAERLADHRLLYLDYEGPVSGGRGVVVRREGGIFSWLVREPGRVQVRLEGQWLRGVLDLHEGEGGGWHGRFETD